MIVLFGPGASASTVGPYQPPNTGGDCPVSPLVTGTFGANNSLIGLWQPDPITGQECEVLPHDTIVGDELIVAIVVTSAPASGIIPIGVEEYTLGTQTYTEPGPNNTTLTLHRQIQENAQWSNTSVAAGPNSILQFALNVPPAFRPLSSPENLTVELLGVTFALQIATPTTQLQVPQTYGQFLGFGVEFAVVAAVVFSSGAGVAYLILARIRHVPSLMKPAGALGFVALAFTGWVWADTRQAIFLLGAVSIFAVYLPLFAFSVLFWLALLPTKAYLKAAWGPVPALTDRAPSLDLLEFRVYRNESYVEWCSNAPWAALLRLFGVRAEFRDDLLTPAPAEYRAPKFSSIRKDLYSFYVVWDCRRGEGSIKEHRPRLWLLPWRKNVRELRARWLREMGRNPADAHVGVLISADDGQLALEAGGERTAAEAIRWPLATKSEGRMATLYDRSLSTLVEVRLATQTQADERARKYATIARIQERLSTNPEAVRQLDAAAAAKVLELFGVSWEELFPSKGTKKEEPIREEPETEPAIPSKPADVSGEAENPDPPWRRRDTSGGAPPAK